MSAEIDNLPDALAEIERLKGVCFEQATQCDRHRHAADRKVLELVQRMERGFVAIGKRLAGHNFDEPYDVGYKQGLKDALIDFGDARSGAASCVVLGLASERIALAIEDEPIRGGVGLFSPDHLAAYRDAARIARSWTLGAGSCQELRVGGEE